MPDESPQWCEECQRSRIITADSYLVCEGCGRCYPVMTFCNELGWNDRNRTYPMYTRRYKKSDHLKRCLKYKKIPYTVKQTIEQTFDRLSYDMQLICKGRRKNFPNYPFIIRKILRMMGKSEHVDCFGQLSSKRLREYHNGLWRELCEKKGWPFDATT